MPCRINVFSGRKRERSPRENPQNGDFGGVSHGDLAFASYFRVVGRKSDKITIWRVSRGDLSPHHAKIRQTGAKTRKVAARKPPNGDFRVFAWRPFAPPGKVTTNKRRRETHEKCRTFVWWGERSPCKNTKKSPFYGFSRGAFSPRKHDNTKWHKSATIQISHHTISDVISLYISNWGCFNYKCNNIKYVVFCKSPRDNHVAIVESCGESRV